jgi:hypothetical protein
MNAAGGEILRLLKDVKVTERPPKESEDENRGETPAAELLGAPPGGDSA